jgi:hypothetical protein
LAFGFRAADNGGKRWLALLDVCSVLGSGAATCLVFAVGVKFLRGRVLGKENGSGVHATKVQTNMPLPVCGNREAWNLVNGIVEAVINQANWLGELAVELLMKLPCRQITATAFVFFRGERRVHGGRELNYVVQRMVAVCGTPGIIDSVDSGLVRLPTC